MKKILLLSLLLFLLIVPLKIRANVLKLPQDGQRIAAAPSLETPDWKKIILPSSNFSGKSASDVVLAIANWIFGFMAVLATFAVVYSGIMYLTAGGDVAKAETARKNLTWAVIGIIVAVTAGVIINAVIKALTG